MTMSTDPFRELDRLSNLWLGRNSSPWMPMDALRHGDVVTVFLDLPGVDPDSIDLTVERNEIKVDAERDAPSIEESQFLVRERPTGKYSRRLYVGENLDTAAIDAEYLNGVLVLKVPLHESAKPRKIDVRATDAQKEVTTGS